MVEFNLKGISVKAIVEISRHDYKDASCRYRTRFDREVRVEADFWGFSIAGNLSELSFIKSTLSFFMQAYWKRTRKEGAKIDLTKSLHHNAPNGKRQSLAFVARQKANEQYLHICLHQDGNKGGECYLDGQEVIMLDIALGKAINLLAPALKVQVEGAASVSAYQF